jgi:hypothetical protein
MSAVMIANGQGPTETRSLVEFHKNPRRSDDVLIRESLATLGQYKPIIVNVGTLTGRPNEVLAGNHVLIEARKLGWKLIDASWVDVDDETANKIVLVDNRSADRGSYDNDALIDLLGDLESFIATGYDEADLAKLLTPFTPPAEPSADSALGDLAYRVVIDCRDEADQREQLERFEAEGRAARPLIAPA